jgi:tetratricopeptide (TPR) repeat protein
MNQLALGREHSNDAGEKVMECSLPDRRQMRERLNALKKEFGPNSIEVADQLFEWGCDFMDAKRFGEAENLLKQAIDKIERYDGADYPAMATAQCFLGSLYLSLDRLDESKTMLLRALSLAEKLASEDLYWAIVNSLMHLAQVFITDDELADAEDILFTILKSTAQHHLYSRNRMIVTEAAERWKGVHQAKRPRGEDPLKGDRPCPEPEETVAQVNDLTFPMTLLAMAQSSASQGNFEEAEFTLQEALSILRAAPGKNDAQVAAVSTELASVKARLGKEKEAKRLFMEALLIANKTGLLDVRSRAEILAKHGDFLAHLGESGRAERAFTMARSARQDVAELERKAWVTKLDRLMETRHPQRA